MHQPFHITGSWALKAGPVTISSVFQILLPLNPFWRLQMASLHCLPRWIGCRAAASRLRIQVFFEKVPRFCPAKSVRPRKMTWVGSGTRASASGLQAGVEWRLRALATAGSYHQEAIRITISYPQRVRSKAGNAHVNVARVCKNGAQLDVHWRG